MENKVINVRVWGCPICNGDVSVIGSAEAFIAICDNCLEQGEWCKTEKESKASFDKRAKEVMK